MKKISLILSLCLVMLLSSCYDDYKFDYEYQGIYFANQSTVQSLIVDPLSDEMSLNVGVVYSGKYDYNNKVKVSYTIADTLVTNNVALVNAGVKVMDPSWYKISNTKTITINNSHMGSVTVNFVKDSLLSHPEAAQNVYVIPFLLTSVENGAATDTILASKNYSIRCIKFVNEYAGVYRLRGSDAKLDENEEVISTINYFNDKSIELNEAVKLKTVSKNEISYDRIGSNKTDSKKYGFIIKMNSPKNGVINSDETSTIKPVVGTADFDYNTQTFINKYSYEDKDGYNHSVNDTLSYCDDGIVFETNNLKDWKK